MAAGTEIFRLFGRIMIETSDAERSLSKTESKAKTFLGTIGNGVVTVAKFAGAVGAAALTAAGAATKVAADFQSQMSNVQTLLTGTQDEIAAKVSKYGDIVKGVSRTTGLETSNLTDGLYQVVSAFGDVDDAAKIMEIAAKSAKAGNAETSDAVNLLSAVTKGYGDISAEANQKAADLAFTTVRLGQTSFPELASSMGKVIPLCATMKVKEEELFGAMATLTGVTGGTAEVSTQLKATIQGFMQPTTAMTSALKKMGYENGQVAIESLGLQGTLDALKESVNGDELAFAGMFSSVEAKTAVLALAGAQSEDFTNKTKEMYSATGAAESAFDTQTANLKGTLGKLKQAASTAVIELGERFLPVVQTLAEWVLENMPAIQATIEVVFDYLTTVTNTCVEYITMLKDAASAWVADHQETVNAILTAIQNLWQFVQTIFSALMTAAGALGDWLGAWADENLGDIVQTVTAAVNSIASFVSAFASWAAAFWQAHGQTIMSIVRPLLEVVKTIISTALQAITQVFNIFAALFRGDWGELFRGIATLVLTILNGIVSTIGNIFQSIINLIFAKYNDMYNAGRSIFQGLFDGIVGVWNSIYNWVVEKVNWLSDRLSFWNSSQSKMRANGSHATGLEYVPFDGYRAILHKGERVLTAEQAKEADKGQNGGNTRVVKVEIGQFINQTEKDIDELVEIIDEKLEERREREERV
jgi:TP901 family phage tail tape measure protein